MIGKDSEDKEYYVDYSRDLFDFFVEARQWTGFDNNKLNRWFTNFQNLENGEYYACKILNCVIGYSENDVLQMLTEGIERIIHKEAILPLLIKKEFSALESELDYSFRTKLDQTLFVPLLANNSPGESSMAMMRTQTQKIKPRLQQMFPWDITDDYPCNTLVIIDDCIGSGEQFSEFWETACIGGEKSLRTWCREKSIHAYYLCLVAYDKTVKTLKAKYDDIDVVAIELIGDKHKIFCMDNDVWDDKKELDTAMNGIQALINEKGINLLGYKDMDFGVIIHNSIPDWSLPIFHKEKNDWKLLVERKDSND